MISKMIFPANLLTGGEHPPSQPITWLILTKLKITTTRNNTKQMVKKTTKYTTTKSKRNITPGSGRAFYIIWPEN